MRTQDRDVVIVTDAGTESGRHLVEELLDAGYRVALTGPHAAALTHSLHGRSAGSVMAVAADMTDPWQSERVRDSVVARFGRIDLIRNAATWERTFVGSRGTVA